MPDDAIREASMVIVGSERNPKYVMYAVIIGVNICAISFVLLGAHGRNTQVTQTNGQTHPHSRSVALALARSLFLSFSVFFSGLALSGPHAVVAAYTLAVALASSSLPSCGRSSRQSPLVTLPLISLGYVGFRVSPPTIPKPRVVHVRNRHREVTRHAWPSGALWCRCLPPSLLKHSQLQGGLWP